MSRAGAKFSEVRRLLMEDEEFRKEYEKLRPRYDVISQIIEARTRQNITQAELAARMGTSKSSISRLEGGTYNPSLDFLVRVASSLGREIQLTLKPIRSGSRLTRARRASTRELKPGELVRS